MVTIAEIEQREGELSQTESQANKILSQKVPRRRFGSGVTPEQQRSLLKRKDEARKVKSDIKQKRKELSSAKQQIQKRNDAIARAEQLQRDYELARKFVNEGKVPFGASKRVRQLFIDIRNERDPRNNPQVQKLEAQGLIPIIQNGRIVGFEDTRNQQSIPFENIQTIAEENPTEARRFEKAGLITLSQSQPTLREEIEQRSIEGNERYSVQSTITNKQLLRIQAETNKDIASAIVQKDLSLNNKYSLIGQLNNDVNNAVRTQQTLFAIGVGTEVIGSAKALPGTIKTIFNQNPITTATNLKIGIQESVSNVITGKTQREFITKLTISPSFTLGSLTGKVIVAEAGASAVSGVIKGLKLTKTIINPKFKPVRSVISEEIPSIEKQIITNVPKISEKGTIELIPKGVERKTAKTLRPSLRGGFGYSQAEQKILLKNPTPLATGFQTKFESFGKPLEREFFSSPGFEGTAQLRVSRLGLGQKRATIIDVFKGKFTLKSQKPQAIIFPEATGFRKIPTPGSELETTLKIGETIIKTGKPAVTIIEKTSIPIYTAKVVKINELSSLELKQSVKFQKTLSMDIKSKPLLSKTELSLPVITSKKSEISQKITTTSLLSKSIIKTTSPTLSIGKITSPIRTDSSLRTTIPPISKQLSSLPIKSPPTRSPPTRSPPTRSPPTRSPPIRPPLTIPRKFKRVKPTTQSGYRTFIIRKGKKVYLTGVRTRGRALEYGQRRALGSLRATFGIERAGYSVKGKDISFKPNIKIFRGYRIRKGKKIKLKDTFIQRKGKRLFTGKEISGIQRARAIKI